MPSHEIRNAKALRAVNNGLQLWVSTWSWMNYLTVTRESDGAVVWSGHSAPYEGKLRPLYARFKSLPADMCRWVNETDLSGVTDRQHPLAVKAFRARDTIRDTCMEQ